MSKLSRKMHTNKLNDAIVIILILMGQEWLRWSNSGSHWIHAWARHLTLPVWMWPWLVIGGQIVCWRRCVQSDRGYSSFRQPVRSEWFPLPLCVECFEWLVSCEKLIILLLLLHPVAKISKNKMKKNKLSNILIIKSKYYVKVCFIEKQQAIVLHKK